MLQFLVVSGVLCYSSWLYQVCCVTVPGCIRCVVLQFLVVSGVLCYSSWLYQVCCVTVPGCIRCVVLQFLVVSGVLCYSSWLYQVCRGIDNEPVKARKLAKSIGCGKNFPGKEILDTAEKVLFLLLLLLVVGRRPQHAVSRLACLVLSSAR